MELAIGALESLPGRFRAALQGFCITTPLSAEEATALITKPTTSTAQEAVGCPLETDRAPAQIHALRGLWDTEKTHKRVTQGGSEILRAFFEYNCSAGSWEDRAKQLSSPLKAIR